ncbi:MAG: branched chain amino acid aminotransferase, partial [Cyclobacteriaceae bacterium]
MDISIKKIHNSKLSYVDLSNIQFGKVYSDHMFVADYTDERWSSFSIVPYDNLKIPPGNFTLHYGQSVFEGLKGYRGDNGRIHVFRPYDNHKRMNISARRLCMPDIPEEIFIDGLKALLQIDKDWVPDQKGTALYIRPFMFGNDEYIGIKPSDNYKFIIFTCPVGSYYSEALKVKIELNY